MDHISELNSQLKKLKDTESIFHATNDDYKAVMDSMAALMNQINIFSAVPQDKDTYRDDLKPLIKDALIACNKYIQSHTKESHSTERGAVRMNSIGKLSEYLSKDMTYIDLMDPSKSLTFEDFASKARTHILEVNDLKKSSVGANMSQRFPVSYYDSKGNLHKGFFTQNENFDIKEKYEQMMENISTDNNFRTRYRFDVSKLYAKDKKFLLKCLGSVDLIEHDRKESIAFMKKQISDFAKTPGVDSPDKLKELIESYNVKPDNTAESIAKLNIYNLIKIHQFDTLVDKGLDVNSLSSILNEISEFAINNSIKYSLNKGAGIRDGRNISSRNVAMSRLANTLGMNEECAFSEKMQIVSNGQTIDGVFMEEAEGIDPNNAPRDVVKNQPQTSDAFDNPSAKKSLAKLQVLDYISGNLDRHLCNVFYKYDKSTKQYTGVMGIDNDTSFGVFGHSKDRRTKIGHNFNVNNLQAIDEDTANMILNTDMDTLKYNLSGCDLSPAEFDALNFRFESLKNEITKGLEHYENANKGILDRGYIRVIPNDGWDKYPLKNLAVISKVNKRDVFENAFSMYPYITESQLREGKPINYKEGLIENYGKKVTINDITKIRYNVNLCLDALKQNESTFHSAEYKAMLKAAKKLGEFAANINDEYFNDKRNDFSEEDKKTLIALNEDLMENTKGYAALIKSNPSAKETARKEIAGKLLDICKDISKSNVKTEVMDFKSFNFKSKEKQTQRVEPKKEAPAISKSK